MVGAGKHRQVARSRRGPQWGRTCINDPDVRATGGRTELVDSDSYERALAVDAPSIDPVKYPNARRRGWLRPAYWSGGASDGLTQHDRRQSFWKRF